MRCTAANRTCRGYDDTPDRLFRQWQKPDQMTVPFASMARKCTLPMLVRDPGTDGPLIDVPPEELANKCVEEYALRAFFYDYCINSVNERVSKGFLDGLERLIWTIGWQSDLANACRVVAFASHGTFLRRPRLIQQAEDMYQELLSSQAKAIANPVSVNMIETLLTAMLLGLYEVRPNNNVKPS